MKQLINQMFVQPYLALLGRDPANMLIFYPMMTRQKFFHPEWIVQTFLFIIFRRHIL